MADPAGSRADLTPAPPGEAAPTDTWWFAALSSELKPGKLQRYDLLGDPVLLGRTRQGGLYALRDICPHRAAPFSAGRLVDDEGPNGIEPRVECPYHGWRFGLDGACRVIPSLVDNTELDPARIRVRTYPVREQQGLVWIWSAANPRALAEPDQDPPNLELAADVRFRRVERIELDLDIEAATRMLADPAANPFRSAPGAHGLTRRGGRRWSGIAARLFGRPAEPTMNVLRPGLRCERRQVGSRLETTLTCLTPVDAARTRVTRIAWST